MIGRWPEMICGDVGRASRCRDDTPGWIGALYVGGTGGLTPASRGIPNDRRRGLHSMGRNLMTIVSNYIISYKECN